MTTYRLFPSTNGPASPASYTGNFISGVVFTVSSGNTWFQGYWWWCCASGQSTAAVKCALWTVSAAGGVGQVVPGSVVTSGTLTAGQWNYIPLSTPVQLAPGYSANGTVNGSCYVAAVGFTNSFPDTNGFWGTGGAGVNGITSGPLFAYSGTAGNGGTAPAPFTYPQGVFSTSSADPSATMPATASTTDNFWVDVQVADTAPSGYSGTYRIWPNKADANPTVTGDAAFNYTIATEIHLSQQCTLDNIWYFSPYQATTLATQCDVWSISSGLSVASITSPAWKDVNGTAFTAGSHVTGTVGTWVKAAFAANTVLAAGSYRVSVYNSAGTTDANWSPKDASTDYWGESSNGAGVSGITQGPLSAPGYASASAGFVYNAANGSATPPFSGGATAHAQPVFGQTPAGANSFPQLNAPVGASTNQTQNYWVDLEATPVPPAAVSSSDSGHAAESASVHASLSGADSGHAADVPRSAWPRSADSAHAADAGSSPGSVPKSSADVALGTESAFYYHSGADARPAAAEGFAVHVSGADGAGGAEFPVRAFPGSADASAASDSPLRSWPASSDAAHAGELTRPFPASSADSGHGSDSVHETGIWTYVPSGVRLLLRGQYRPPRPPGELAAEHARLTAAVLRMAGRGNWVRVTVRVASRDRCGAAESGLILPPPEG